MSLSDLTGTKWVLNNSLSSYAGGSYTIKFYNVNITTDEATDGINAGHQATDTFVDIAIGYSGGIEKNVVWFGISGIELSHLFASGHDTKSLPDAWDQVLTIPFTITGGTDATNSALISWLESNATQSITPVDILLGSSSIASLSTTGSVTLATQNTYLANDITVSFTKTIGSATTPSSTIYATPTISVSSSGLITATVTQSQSITPIVTPGYISSGTAGTVTVSVSNIKQLTKQAAQTITPTTTNQTIASGKYLTGTQTIEGIVCTNLTAENIADGVTVKIGTATDDDSVASVTGTHQGGGGGVEVDTCTINISTMQLSTIWATRIVDNTIVTSMVEPEYSNSYTIQDVVCGSYMRVHTTAYILTGFSSINGSSHVFENNSHNEHMIQVTTASTDTIRLRDDD